MSTWEIFEVRAEEKDSEYTIAASRFDPDHDDVQIWANLRVRERDGQDGLDLIQVDVSALRAAYGEDFDMDVPISVSEVRNLPYAQLIARAQLLLQAPGMEVSPEEWTEPDYAALRHEWPNGDLKAVSKGVATIYHLAVADGRPTQQAVQETFGVSRSTAGRMIAKARELGEIQVTGVVGRPRQQGTKTNGEAETETRSDREDHH